MTDDQDKEFEKYLAGDSGLSDAYAKLPEVEPPAYLDYAIRDEAHRVVGAGAARGRPSARERARAAPSGWRAWQKWTMPLSVAATLIIVAMVGLQLPYIIGQAPESRTPAGAPGGVTSDTRQPVSVQSSSVAKPEASPAPVRQEQVRGKVAAQEAQPAAKGLAPAMREVPAAAPPAMQAAPPVEQGAVLAPAARRAAPQPAPAPAAMEAAPAPAAEMAAPAAAVQEAPASQATAGAPQQQAPGPWLARIRKLKQEGRQAEAKQALAAFSKRYPAYPVPGDLRDLR